jgi:Kef-type K+ transport system membrane component KefB
MVTSFPGRNRGPAPRFLYPLLVVGPLLAILLALHFGSALVPAPREGIAASPSPPGGTSGPSFGLLLAQILAVLAATRACGLALRPFGQPPVVGEMLAGILLGPSFLGLLAPEAATALFPAASLGVLSALSQVGMVLYMFLVGMELDTSALRERGEAAVLVSHSSIAVPFASGTALAAFLFGGFAPAGVAFVPFALFLGAAMSVTAFPVLARILAERGLLRSPLGTLALSAAAVDDVTAWTILAGLTVYVTSAGAAGVPWASIAGLGLFVSVAFFLRRPLRDAVTRAFDRHGGITHGQIAALVSLAILGAGITEALSLHALFGAFFVVVLLPLYFAFTGLRTRLDLVFSPTLGALALLIILVAVAGKLGASALAGWACGLPAREALALGALMNTRGLMELVILNIGLDLGVLSPALFSIMVLMAFSTTLMTTPLLRGLGIGTEGAPPSP